VRFLLGHPVDDADAAGTFLNICIPISKQQSFSYTTVFMNRSAENDLSHIWHRKQETANSSEHNVEN